MALGTLKNGAIFLPAVVLLRLALCPAYLPGVVAAGEAVQRESVNREADFSQADMMLKLLRSSAGGNVDSMAVESVLNAHGTALIIGQQNISRAVTVGQYRTLLKALGGEVPPDIAPVDETEKARRGVEGLRKDVWPALRWARANTNLLAGRIEEIKQLELSRNSVVLATRFLPEQVELSPRLYVVMGGRAGAAAPGGGEIYFDVLAMSYRAANGSSPYPTPVRIGEYFAHEVHHIGLSRIIDRTRGRLRLSDREQRAFGFLTSIVMEGSASYLINGHRNLEAMRRDPEFTENLNKSDELLKLSERTLRAVLEDGLDGEAYERFTTPFLGSGWHSAGAAMLAAIDRADGLRAVMKVLRDPRKLLVAYNRGAAKLKRETKQQTFDTMLAKRVSVIGA